MCWSEDADVLVKGAENFQYNGFRSNLSELDVNVANAVLIRSFRVHTVMICIMIFYHGFFLSSSFFSIYLTTFILTS